MKKSLINRFLNKSLTTEELNHLYKEINRNSSEFIHEIETDWDSFELDPKASWPESHWLELENQLKHEPTHQKIIRVFQLQWVAKIAASLLLIATVWFAANQFMGNRTADSESPGLITKTNNSHKPKSMVLKDGTRVILTANSSISYYENFNKRYRVVHLEGEAYFETRDESDRPFIVISQNITAFCRGKQFSISAYKDSNEINVISASGQIEIAQNDRLNSENNKVAVQSCQSFSFDKANQQYLIGQVSDCDYNEKVRSMRKKANLRTVAIL